MTIATFLKQASGQIELGFPSEAIARLMVLLDLAAENGTRLDQARSELTAHPVFALLQQDPAVAVAQVGGADRINRLVSQISSASNHDIAASAFNRAICARVKHAGDLLSRAWQDGREIAVLGDCFDAELMGLRGRDLSNLTIGASTAERAAQLAALLGPSAAIAALNATDILIAAAAARSQFDLIYLPRAAETMDAAALASLLEQARTVLAPAGSIVAPAFLAGRIAHGWQHACLNWRVQSHSEVGLAAACSSENLQVRLIGDQAGCFVWLVASQANSSVAKRGELP